jgi:RHS repeat-associated protein
VSDNVHICYSASCSRTECPNFHSYTYDDADRLKTWVAPGASVTYDYDKAGNRTIAGPQTFNYDDRNRLTTTSAGSYAWTARGTPTSQTVNGQTTTYTADAASRVTSASKPGTTVTYGLDGLDRVKTRTATGTDLLTFYYSGFENDPYTQFSINPSTGTYSDLRKYSRDPDGQLFAEQSNMGTVQVGTDVHGDANLWSSLGGYGVLSSKVYDPFGGIAGTTSQIAGYTSALGYQSDYTDPTTGDVNMGARWYNPSTATFRSRDTYAGKLQTPFSLNRYTYGLGTCQGV